MEEINRDEVERRLDRLRADYDPPVDVVDEVVPDDRFGDLRGVAEDGYTGGGYAWVVRRPEEAPPLSESMPSGSGPHDEHVLLVLGRGSDETEWGIPGGGREDGETYEAAARREVREETGIEAEIGAPYHLTRARTTADGVDAAVHTLWAYFDARYSGGRLDLQPTELSGGAWFVEPPGAMNSVTATRAAAFWPDCEPPERAVDLGPDDENEVEVRSLEAGAEGPADPDSGE